jgi:hypothetical protein
MQITLKKRLIYMNLIKIHSEIYHNCKNISQIHEIKINMSIKYFKKHNF